MSTAEETPPPRCPQDKHVIIVDDLVQTGGTLIECGKRSKELGASISSQRSKELHVGASISSQRWKEPGASISYQRSKELGASISSQSSQEPDTPALQQDDNFEPFMDAVLDGGLNYAYHRLANTGKDGKYYRQKVSDEKKRKVVVVGAGIAGLVTAYELSQIGHDVTILELQNRVGGRIKTCRDGFLDGLHSEGGAMRIPPNHFLTHFYINRFNIELKKFQNYQGNAFMFLYDEKIRMDEFIENNRHYCDKYWPGWDANLPENHEINGAAELYDLTVKPVKAELGTTPSNKKWFDWVAKWSKFSVEDFLRSSEPISPYLPWPEAAIQAFKVATYSPMLISDLVSALREDLGRWWQDNLETPVDGMDAIPKAFLRNDIGYHTDINLAEKIIFSAQVEKIELSENGSGSPVSVTARNAITGSQTVYPGDAVFVTVPLNILRNIEMPGITTPKLVDAISGVTYAPSTKIMIQCRDRFWQKPSCIGGIKKDGIYGGFSKTNMTIGQLHYPDSNENHSPDEKRGVLLVYTWADDALILGSQTHTEAIQTVVKQISKIHPEMAQQNQFEAGIVQAWFSDPSSQGAFANLHPFEYTDHMKTLQESKPPVYFAGEAISWSNGWMQGAIFSALIQAFRFQASIEDPSFAALQQLNVKADAGSMMFGSVPTSHPLAKKRGQKKSFGNNQPALKMKGKRN